MNRPPIALLSVLVLALAAGCAHKPPPPVAVAPSSRAVNFLTDVQPVLEKRCVVCHSCYNSPCQLKLSSFEGLERGGSKIAIYNSTRLRAQDPTRLFIDATSTAQWRHKGFHSVVTSNADEGYNNSLMLQLLDARMHQTEMEGEYHAESDDLTCAADGKELGGYLEEHPKGGMPFGFPALDPEQYELMAAWLQQGAPGPSAEEQHRLTSPSEEVAIEIAKWEEFLNRKDPKHAMTARYLYEHYFLAHLIFSDVNPRESYELVRSRTAPGQPIDIIPSVRPYDPPGSAAFYYRFRKVHSTIVHKTHIVVELGDQRLERIRELFIASEWQEKPHYVKHDTPVGPNPFLVYAQIPPKVRYQFLLDHAEYTMRTFIRGPVCKGQVALNVIRDHFWVMFLDPEADATLKHPEFLVKQADNLRLPTEEGSNDRVLATFRNSYRERYANYYVAKTKLYENESLRGFGFDAIWKGQEPRDAPVLTVYRHFDSASVHKGVLGKLPRTLWVIDYAQFERLYYGLVAGFDVFGNVSHQVNIRRYMDYLRIEGELNFVQFLPREQRLATMRAWYLGDGAFDDVQHERVLIGRNTDIAYQTDDPKREFVERLIDDQIPEAMGIAFDKINYVRAGDPPRVMPEKFESHEDVIAGLRALTVPGTGFIRHMNGFGVNLIYVRVRGYQGADRFVSIVINRWHDNVNSMFSEKKRLDPKRDTIDFVVGSIGSYPNYFFDLHAEDVPDFFDMLQHFDGSPRYLEKVLKYGVNRADPRFWEAYEWFQEQLNQADPLQAGLYDLNRYYFKAVSQQVLPKR